MEMINFDEHKEKPTKHHYLLPDYHYMLIRQTGCGKTNTLCSPCVLANSNKNIHTPSHIHIHTYILCNMLLQSWLNCDKVILYAINPQQPKYQPLYGFYNGISPGNLIIEQPDKVCPVEDLDDQENKVIIFNDIKIDKKNMTKVMEYFSLSRNKKCNYISLSIIL